MAKKSSKNKNLSGRNKPKFDVGGINPDPNQSTNQWLASMRAPFITPSQKMFPLKMDRGMPDFSGALPQGTYSPVGAPQGTISSGDQSYAPGSYYTGYENKYDVDPNQFGVQQGPQTLQRAQELGYEQKVDTRWRNPFENVKGRDVLNMAPIGLYATNAFLRKQDAIRNQQNFQNRLRNVFTQKPIYDYNYLYGPDSSGGTQYQSLIMAKNGAQIRKGTSPDITDVEVEGGEFIQLPDLSTQHVQGPSHAKGGVHTNLPEGTRVFSDYLKPIGSKKTYAQIAKKYDTEKYREILENPYANDIDRRTASLLFKKYESILNELFKDQQKQNGNSDGTDQALGMEEGTMAKFGLDLKKGEKLSFTNPFMFGGYYQQGGEYELPYEDEDNLFQVYNPYNAYNNFDEYAPISNPTTMDNMEEYEQGGQYLGGNAYLNGGGSIYEDGGMFPENSKFYGATPGDTSVLTTGTQVMGNANFQDGGYYSPEGKKYKIPKGTVVKEEGDKTIKAGDYVKRNDGTVVKVTKIQAKMYAKSTASSKAKDYEEGRLYLEDWINNDPQNAEKLKRANEIIKQGIDAKQITVTETGKDGKPTRVIVGGNFKPSFRDRMLLSEVINKTGGGFGTDQYFLEFQNPTEGYAKANKEGKYKGTGSFMGGMTPEDYEQRATYERALVEGLTPEQAEALATTTDPKQRLENRKRYLKELNLNQFDNTPDTYLMSDQFYKKNYEDITRGIEQSFDEAGFRPFAGNDQMSGWEHYDAAAYAKNPSYANIEVEEPPGGIPPGNTYPGVTPFKQIPSIPGRFPMYQAIPEAMGYLAGLNPYSYYTPDYTHTEVAPPTLNIDPQLQSINNSLQSTIRQSTGNASVDSSRRAALFNQALDAKQQAFANKQNYDAEARFKADIYNADARTKENYLDVSAAADVYNQYMAVAQDSAERERLNAIANLVKKRGQFTQDELNKILYVSSLMPNFYYEGTDLRNPLKLNPNAEEFYSKMANAYPNTQTVTTVTPGVGGVPGAVRPQVNVSIENKKEEKKEGKKDESITKSSEKERVENLLNLNRPPVYSYPQPAMGANINYPSFGPTYQLPGYPAISPNAPVTMLPPSGPYYNPYVMPEITPEDLYRMDEGKMKFGGRVPNKSRKKTNNKK